MLSFEKKWRFESPGPIEPEVKWGFLDLINKIGGQKNRQLILEHFKSHSRVRGSTISCKQQRKLGGV